MMATKLFIMRAMILLAIPMLVCWSSLSVRAQFTSADLEPLIISDEAVPNLIVLGNTDLLKKGMLESSLERKLSSLKLRLKRSQEMQRLEVVH